MPEERLNLENQKVYCPDRKKQFFPLAVFGFVCLFLVFAGYRDLAKELSGAAPVKGLSAFMFLAGLFLSFLWLGLAGSLLRGFPRLILTNEGLELKTFWGRHSARWESLSDFVLMETTVSSGFRKRKFLSLRAIIVGGNVSDNLLEKQFFDISDSFSEALGNIRDALNERRGKVWLRMTPDEASRIVNGYKTAQAKIVPAGLSRFRAPWLTYGLLAVLLAVFGAEFLFSVMPTKSFAPSIQTLLALGALNKTLVLNYHDWYRLLSSSLLHANALHLLFNGVALYFAGAVLERLIGRSWFFALFFVGALGGALMSLALGAENSVSVGASGAIMGLFAAICALSFRLPAGETRTRLQTDALRVLIPSLIPLFASTGIHIDYSAHFGGALSGGLLGFFLYKTWAKENPLPGYQAAARTIAVIGILIFAGSLVETSARYATNKRLFVSALQEEMRPGTAETLFVARLSR